MKLSIKRLASAAIVASVALAACGGDDDSSDEPAEEPADADDGAAAGDDDAADDGDASSGDGDLSGSMLLDGSSTVGPLAEVAAELFMDANSGVRVDVAISGTGGGFQRFCIGETDMNNSSRPIKDEEIETCEENGIGYDAIQVSNDALSLVVNPDNPIECMTPEQASQLWGADSTVSTWGEIDGLDLRDDFAAGTITLYGPGHDSGTFDFFTEAINGESGNIRADYVDIGEDDHAAVLGVEGDANAIGYIPYSYVQEVGDSVRALQIDGGDGCVDATLENVQNGSYTPLGRPLFTYASDTSLARPEVVAFMEFWIENSDFIAEAAVFVPMTDEQKAEQFAKIAQLAGG